MVSSMARRRAASTFDGVISARRSNAASMVACSVLMSTYVAKDSVFRKEGAYPFRGRHALLNICGERDANAVAPRIDPIHLAREVAPRQHGEIPGRKQVACEALV